MDEESIDNVVIGTPVSTEEIARQGGWKPLEEWDKDPEDWIGAREFNQRGEYMERIKSQSSLIKKLEKKVNTLDSTYKELSEHHRKVREVERKRALDDLKSMKKDALDLGDHDTVVDIDEKILDLRKEEVKQQSQPQQEEVELHPDLQEWIEQNSWYTEDPALKGAAEGLVADLLRKEPHLQGKVKEVLTRVTTQIKEEFPNKFGRKSRSTVTEPSGSDSGTNTRITPKFTARHMNAEQLKVAKKYVADGTIKSLDEYARQLGDIGELDNSKGRS